MRRPRRPELSLFIGIFAIAALLCTILGARVIAAQEATADATNQQQVTAGPAGTETAENPTPAESTDTGETSETPPAIDGENGEAGDPSEENPAPSDEPAPRSDSDPADHADSGPAEDTTAGSDIDQSASARSWAATPGAAATPAAPATESPCPMGGTALPEVGVSGTDFGTPVFDGTAYSPVTTTITITLTLPSSDACLASTWSIAMSASAMRAAGGETSPSGDITYQGISGPTSPGLGVAGLALGTSLATAQTVVTGTDQTLDENHPSLTFTVTLAWSPSADATAGQYTSRITIKSIAGETASRVGSARAAIGHEGDPGARRE